MCLKIQSWWRFALGYQPYVFGLFAVLSLILGVIGYLVTPPPDGPFSLLNAVYYTLALFVLEMPLSQNVQLPIALNVARFLAPALTLYALLKATMLILVNLHESWYRQRLRDHRIVCGLGQRGRFLAVSEGKSKERVVAIDSNPHPELKAICESHEISLIPGNAAEPSILQNQLWPFAWVSWVTALID